MHVEWVSSEEPFSSDHDACRDSFLSRSDMSCIKRALLITHILKATLIIIVIIIIIIILSYVHSFIGGLCQGHPLWLWFLYITFFFNFPSLLWLWAEAAFLPKLFWILSVSEIPKSAPSVYHSINYFSSLNHLIFCLLTVLLPLT